MYLSKNINVSLPLSTFRSPLHLSIYVPFTARTVLVTVMAGNSWGNAILAGKSSADSDSVGRK